VGYFLPPGWLSKRSNAARRRNLHSPQNLQTELPRGRGRASLDAAFCAASCYTLIVLTKTRKSVPLDLDDVALVNAIKDRSSLERLAVETIAGDLPQDLSEAQVIKLLLDLGKSVVSEAVLNAQYAAYQADLDDEDCAYQKASRKRRDRAQD